MLPGKLGNMMKKAQEMQENMQKMQAELASKTVTGVAGAGAVKVTLNGHYACQGVALSDEAMAEDREMLEALLAAAFSDGVNKVRELNEEQMRQITGGIELPAGFKFPF